MMRVRAFVVVAAAATAPSLGAGAASSTVEQVGQQFSQKSIVLNKGDTIVFGNRDDVTHNVTVLGDADAADLGLQKPGMDLVYKFDTAGRFRVRCSIHPGMKMTVDVK